MTPRTRWIVIGAAAACGLVAGWFGLRAAGILGGGADVKVLAEVPAGVKPPAAAVGNAGAFGNAGAVGNAGAPKPGGNRAASGDIVIPTERPAHRKPVDIGVARVPPWFADVVREGRMPVWSPSPGGPVERQPGSPGLIAGSPTLDLGATAKVPTAAAVRRPGWPATRPADPLDEARAVFGRRQGLSAWFARWQADLGAERPPSDARLAELESLAAAETFAPPEVDAVARALSRVEGTGGRTLAAWARSARPATAPAASPATIPPGAPAFTPATAPATSPATRTIGAATTRPTN